MRKVAITRGAATVPAAFQLSRPELIQVYTGLWAPVPAWWWPLPDSRPRLGSPEEGGGHAEVQPRCSQAAQSFFRIPELPSLGRALQALTTSWFSKEVCGFSFFFLSLFSHRDKEKLVKDKLPGGGGACPALENFHQGFLTWSAAW